MRFDYGYPQLPDEEPAELGCLFTVCVIVIALCVGYYAGHCGW